MPSSWVSGLLAGFALWITLTSTPFASAQAEDNRADAQARAHFQTGSVAFEGGNYPDALVEFRKAYKLSRKPQLLYNIAVTADRLREDQEALDSFEEYLRQVPDAPERAQVTGRIAVLRQAIQRAQPAEVQAAPSASPSPTPTPTRAPDDHATSQSSNVAPWILLSASSLVAVTGGVLLAMAMADRSTVIDADVGVRLDEIEAAHNRVPTLSWAGGLMLGVGLVGAGVSIAWLSIGDDSEAAQTTVNVGIGTVDVRGSW